MSDKTPARAAAEKVQEAVLSIAPSTTRIAKIIAEAYAERETTGEPGDDCCPRCGGPGPFGPYPKGSNQVSGHTDTQCMYYLMKVRRRLDARIAELEAVVEKLRNCGEVAMLALFKIYLSEPWGGETVDDLAERIRTIAINAKLEIDNGND